MKNFLTVAIGVVFGIALWNLAAYYSPFTIVDHVPVSSTTTRSIEVSYIDMVSLMLTGVTIILTVLGFVLAVLAFVGWKSIQAIAANSARKVVREAISDGGKLETLLKKEVQNQLRYQGVEEVDIDFDESNGVGSEDGA